MKNQYFGDNKDLFKYDLTLMIMRAELAKHFTFVPMLTEPDGTRHGEKANRKYAKAGIGNKELVNFLDECIRRGKRDIVEMVDFFRRYDIGMEIYHGEDGYFSHSKRKSYFAGIRSELLSKSLILLDPDNGLEVKNPSEKHVLYCELKELYDRMDEDSILMVYQYFPRTPRQQYMNSRMEELKENIKGEYPVCIYNSEIAFFFLTKNGSLEHSLIHLIDNYAKRYSN